MSEKNIVFVKNYGVYTVGQIAHFHEELADRIISLGAATEYKPVIEDRKVSVGKAIRKGKK